MKRRGILAGAGVLAAAAAGVWRFTDLVVRHYPPTPYDDVLEQVGDRDSAKILGSAALQTLPGFDPAEAAAKLRHGGLQQAIGADIASGRMREVAGWVLPDSLVMAAALAAKA